MKEYSRHQILLGILICAVGAMFYCYEFILRIVPGILQNELRISFGNISASVFGQLSALYYFAYSPMQLPVGILMDRFGARKLLFLACFCCSLGSYLFGFYSSITVAGIGRFLVGFGSSFAFVGVLASAVSWLPQKYFSTVAGLMTTLGMLGLVYGEIKISSLANSLTLANINYLFVGAGFILTIIIFAVVKDNPNDKYSKELPILDFFKQVGVILKSKRIWIIGFIGACLYTSLSIFGELWGNEYLAIAHNLSKTQSAKTISYMFIGWGIGAPISGFISDKINSRIKPLMLGSIFSLVFICIILYTPNVSISHLNILMLLYGIFSSTEILVFIMAKESILNGIPGTIFAVINMIVTLGGAIFQPLVGKVLDISNSNNIINQVHIYTPKDYQIALSIIPICLILTVLSLLFISNKKNI